MSSLSDQLKQVANNSATVAVDRKRRQKLHSASLIYNPKTAATQDYDFIFEHAIKALNELIEIEPKFQIFTKSLFSESSINIDRNVQTKQEIRDLDNAINGYLLLASSKWHLTPTLHATEWLVRRFQIHILNAENFLLSTLNYYQTPVFKRLLNITRLPPLFMPLSNFVRSEQSPSNMTMIKLFDDMDFLKLYTNYLNKCIKQKTTYTNQLLFTTCCFINLIAFNSNNEEKLNNLVPLLLEISAKLLATNSVDCQIAAHTVLVVFATALPLKKEIIAAAAETILSNLANNRAKKSALISICKLFQTLKGAGNVDQLPNKLYKLFDSKFNLDTDLIEFLSDNGNSNVSCDKFLTTYIRAIIRYDHDKFTSLVKLLKLVHLERFEVRLIITDLIHLSEIIEDKSQLIALFEYFISINEKLVLHCLKSLNLTAELFEIRLTTSLFTGTTNADDTNIINSIEGQKVVGQNNQIPSFQEFKDKNAQFINTKDISMFVESDEKFSKLLSLFIEAIGKTYQANEFLTSFITTLEAKITFLLRVLVSPAAPIALRLVSLNSLSKFLNNIDKESNLFTLIPCLICALSDVSKNVRTNVKKILIQISKRPYTKHYFANKRLYGDDIAIPMVSPKDNETWLKRFLDEYLVENYDIANLVIPKKDQKIFLMFWANQALLMPLPYPKTILLNYLNKYSSSSSSFSTVFEKFISNYLQQRTSWESKCINNKTDFVQFETELVQLIAPKEKNQFLIDFAINSLNSEFESLATLVSERLISIFDSLKSNVQLQFLQNILNASAESDPSYDSVGTLQSLPLTAELFVSILSQNRISTDSDATEFPKRRRRRSSTNKIALQKEEVSQMAEIHLRKLTIILETLDRSKNIIGTDSLLSTLFALLSDLETLDQDGGLPVLYAQETLTSCMLNTINSLKKSGRTQLGNIRADILVSAIRSSPSPQVQNKLLLVIGALASLNSETILHSVMPIFTFMGAHSIRQDDEFTTQVVERTILTVIPALLANNAAKKNDEIEFLLTSFTTALQHVPRHRRVKLYSTLVKSLGATDAIGPFFFLISQQYSSNMGKFKLGEARNISEFAKSFLANFDVFEQLHALTSFFEIFKKIISASQDSEKKSELESQALFTNGVLNLTENELFTLLHHAFAFIDKVIQEDDSDHYNINGSFRLRVYSALLDTKNDASFSENVRSEFGNVLESVLTFINKTGTSFLKNVQSSSSETDDESGSETIIDHKTEIKNVLFSLLGNVLNMLPIKDFVGAVLPLLSKSGNEEIRYHLALVIGTKFELESIESTPTASEVIKFLLERIPIENSSTNVAQVELNTLRSLITRFGSKMDNSLLTETLGLVTKTLLSDKTEIVISSLTVIATCIGFLGVKAIAFYPKIVPPTIKIFNQIQNSKDALLNPQMQLSVLLLFASIIKTIPSFVVSNLYDVFEMTFFATEVETATRLSIISLVVENINLKEVLKVLSKIWMNKISQIDDSIAVSLFLSALESTVEKIDKKSATSQSPIFFKLLLSLFEYRSISKFDNNTISRIEASAHQIANVYVLKLNDKVFRPLFVILLRWAFDGEDVVNKQITDVERLTAFFKFFNKLQENLKGIITSYFTYLLEPTNDLLKRFISKKIVDVNLRRLVLKSLTSAFKYDKDEYWKSTSRFELICDSLVNQLFTIENVIGKYLVKAIGSLAANNNGIEEHNQVMNKLFITHMKATCSSSEKLWAIRAVKLVYSKVGESWLVLLPQLVPTIVELLEDDDEEVEHEVRTGLVKVVENVLGEPFDRYLD
ncbi:snoRNA-binding rRNA-processing protein UTP10 NDAI_0G05360 [Naumovozyma dairenensis CBS 421]|uniref:U3 small nucleolar RNA-associated protein 10 n=1 Tax=Naumovozyma dairenensis (strain ATCC 10597 / BCRC 20456 / CBS 421 / NBRC 0211 / NRRL Y-12639) TaxID=1071378 RepID=J7REI1_NAUDC|nr:hypothetical protein NDAI_0G05360 [Naumovozyma dairenensis CBS 421]CCK73519.1 hypothetical protein NDAI_0G05360 [Naumovozyma dairenensis CBS 421]